MFRCRCRIVAVELGRTAPLAGCSSAWLERLVRDQEVEGSNPFSPTHLSKFAMATSHEYVPGVCNIGRAEIRQRKLIGWVGTRGHHRLVDRVCGSATLRPCGGFRCLSPRRLPRPDFCRRRGTSARTFGVLGVSNFGPNVGKTDTVEQAEFRRQDRRTALKIIALSVLAGALVAAAAYFLPSD